MAFTSDSLDQTQRVNLSEQAYHAIENDVVVFCKKNESLSHFLNRVIINFKDNAQASISIALTKERQNINEHFNVLPAEERYQAVSYCIDYYHFKLLASIYYPKGRTIRFRINNENFRYLTET